jgi:hypothetical protein
MAHRITKTIRYKNQTYYLFDVQYSKENAEYSAQLYLKRLIGANWLVKEIELGVKPKRIVFGIYSTKKTTVRFARPIGGKQK